MDDTLSISSQSAERQAAKVGVSLFPEHVNIVRQYAEESGRTFSNAVQFIIIDWARQKRGAVEALTVRESA